MVSDPGNHTGAAAKTSYAVSQQATLYVSSGDAVIDTSRFIYTDNGKTPSVLNGAVKTGKLIEDTYPGAGYAIPLNEYPVGKTVTFKIREINGMGVAGKVATVKVKIVPSEASEILNNIEVNVAVPEKLVAGKSVVAKATVTSSYTEYNWNPET
jgi:hypothetical protein